MRAQCRGIGGLARQHFREGFFEDGAATFGAVGECGAKHAEAHVGAVLMAGSVDGEGPGVGRPALGDHLDQLLGLAGDAVRVAPHGHRAVLGGVRREA